MLAGQAAAPTRSSTTETPLILASASPRRRELLARLGITDPRVIAADIDESPLPREIPRDHAVRLASAKGPRGGGAGARAR